MGGKGWTGEVWESGVEGRKFKTLISKLKIIPKLQILIRYLK